MAQQKRHAAVKASTAEGEPAAVLGTVRWIFSSGLPFKWGLSTAPNTQPAANLIFDRNALPYDLGLITAVANNGQYYLAYQRTSTGNFFTAPDYIVVDKTLSSTARRVAVSATYSSPTFRQLLSNLIANPA
jgi:hypothetical protein